MLTCKGLGQYLSSIDPQERSAEWHLQSKMIISSGDSARSIERAIEHDDEDHQTNEADIVGANDSLVTAVAKYDSLVFISRFVH